nr:hypothetical protein [Enterobacter asburiae]
LSRLLSGDVHPEWALSFLKIPGAINMKNLRVYQNNTPSSNLVEEKIGERVESLRHEVKEVGKHGL